MSLSPSNDASSLTMQEKFENKIYLLDCAPRILDVENYRVFVNKKGPYPDEIEALESMNWEENRILTEKLEVDCYGDFDVEIGIINTKHFDTRLALDTLFVRPYRIEGVPKKAVERISLEDALKHLAVKISCNVDYYLSSRSEIEKDLGRKLDEVDLNSKELAKELEAELFYNEMIKIFGEDNDDDDKITTQDDADHKFFFEKQVTLKEFHLLYEDEEDKIATARRGDYYLLFFSIRS